MLKGKNVVIVKGEKDSPATIKEYERVYLENASTDTLESFTKTSEGKDLEFEGKKWEGLRPVGGQNVIVDTPEAKAVFGTRVSKLMEEALNYFTDRFPLADPYVILLEAASYGADLWERNSIQAAIRPSKPVDKASAIQKMVKILMAMNPKLTLAKATLAATAASESEESNSQAA